jgi:hypothetical protein
MSGTNGHRRLLLDEGIADFDHAHCFRSGWHGDVIDWFLERAGISCTLATMRRPLRREPPPKKAKVAPT